MKGNSYDEFIDIALASQHNLSDDDFLQAMAEIYHNPEVWEVLHQYPQYIQDVVYIIDYDTELQTEGLASVSVGAMSEQYDKVHTALLNCGAVDEARILEEAQRLDIDSDSYDRQIESLTALHNDYEHFWDLVRAYIGKNRDI